MTKRVLVPTFRKQQRAGEGARPVRVRGQGRSLLSRQGKRQKPEQFIRLWRKEPVLW